MPPFEELTPPPPPVLLSLATSRFVLHLIMPTSLPAPCIDIAHKHACICKNSEDGKAVAAHRARLPLSFFHQIPSPPCHQPGERERTGLKRPPFPSGEGGPRNSGGGGTGDDCPPSPGAPAVGLYQGDNARSYGTSPAGETSGGLEQEEVAGGGKETKRAEGEASGAGAVSGTLCVWRHCVVKGRAAAAAAAEGLHTCDVAVVVEWDDEAGGQVRRGRDLGCGCFRRHPAYLSAPSFRHDVSSGSLLLATVVAPRPPHLAAPAVFARPHLFCLGSYKWLAESHARRCFSVGPQCAQRAPAQIIIVFHGSIVLDVYRPCLLWLTSGF